MNIDVDKIVVSLDVVTPDAVVVEASAVAPSGIVTEAVAKLPTQVIVISHEETPTVTPLQIIDYGSSSIECAFDVTTEQADEVVKGVLCGTINPPTFENADYRLLHGQGSMDLAFAGLNNNTEYYLRPYALSNLGYKYGDVVAQRTKASPIPDEYQLVEYIESTGTQYINIPYFLASGNTIEMELVNKNTGNDNCFIGGNQGSNRFFAIYDYPAGSFDLGYVGNNAVSGFSRQERMVVKAVMEVGNQQLFKNGNQIYQGYNNTIINLPHSLKIFCMTQGGYNSKGECYHVVISRNNQIDLNLYPVYRKADNKPGMYDIVNNAFYTNQGSGEFIVGPDKEWEE